MAPRTFQPIVGRKEMADILGIHRNNTHRLTDLPPSLQERYGDDVIAVGITPLWFRADIERYVQLRDAQRAAKTPTRDARAPTT